MATKTGRLAASKPAATTNTVLYRTPIDSSASAVLTAASDGTGAAIRVAIKEGDQKLTLDASTYKLHRGDVITNKILTFDTAIPAITNQQDTFTAGQLITSDDGEASFRWESYFIPTFTTINVRKVTLKAITLESVTGTFAIGDTVTSGAKSALVYEVSIGSGGASVIYVGPETGGAFVAGDSISNGAGASATISAGGIGTATPRLVFSTNGTLFGLYQNSVLSFFLDRTYRFDVSHASMSGVDFNLSTTINGIFGPDGVAGAGGDDGTQYTTGRTTNGTAGSGGAYVQYDLSLNGGGTAQYYYYDANDGTIGASNRYFNFTTSYSYTGIRVYDLQGTWTNNVTSITRGNSTFTLTSSTGSKWGYVLGYSGSTLTVAQGVGSAAFAATDTFLDVPIYGDQTRSTVTVNAVATDVTAVDNEDWILYGKTVSANTQEKMTSLVLGPGQTLIVYAATQNISFMLDGFQDTTTELELRSFDESNVPGGAVSG